MKIFTVHDKKANSYSTPMFQPTEIHAVRIFREEVNRAERGNMLNAYPEDFALYQIGEYDDESGTLSATSPGLVIEATACIKKDRNNA